jgi:hypothetical protein
VKNARDPADSDLHGVVSHVVLRIARSEDCLGLVNQLAWMANTHRWLERNVHHRASGGHQLAVSEDRLTQTRTVRSTDVHNIVPAKHGD